MEEDFEQTLDLIRQVPFSQAFTFMYSKRSGTAAANLTDQIPLEVKKLRLQRLIELQNARSLSWRMAMVDQDYEVLVEGPSKTNPEQLTGRTRGNEVVVFKGDPDLIGSLVNVRIVSANSWTLFGSLT